MRPGAAQASWTTAIALPAVRVRPRAAQPSGGSAAARAPTVRCCPPEIVTCPASRAPAPTRPCTRRFERARKPVSAFPCNVLLPQNLKFPAARDRAHQTPFRDRRGGKTASWTTGNGAGRRAIIFKLCKSARGNFLAGCDSAGIAPRAVATLGIGAPNIRHSPFSNYCAPAFGQPIAMLGALPVDRILICPAFRRRTRRQVCARAAVPVWRGRSIPFNVRGQNPGRALSLERRRRPGQPLQAARGADAMTGSHEQPGIERRRLKQHALADVIQTAQMHPAQAAGSRHVRKGPFELLASLALQPLAASAPDPSAVRVRRLAIGSCMACPRGNARNAFLRQT